MWLGVAPSSRRDQHGNSALHIAAKGGHGELIQMLAGARANVNLQATTTGATARRAGG